MKIWLRIFSLTVAIVIFNLLPPMVRACGCILSYEGLPPCQAYWSANVVFSGLVTEITPLVPVDPNNPSAGYTERGRVVRFAIEGAYRGVTGPTVEVTLMGSSCDYNFKQGERYFVYAGRSPADNRIYTSNCGRTRLLSEAIDDLAYVQALAKKEPSPSMFGIVMREVRSRAEDYRQRVGLEGIKIIIEGGAKPVETFTDSNGRFQEFGLPDGLYHVRAEIPQDLKLTFGDQMKQVQIVAPKCSGVSFVTTSLGSLNGLLADATGNPLAKTKINLVPVDTSNKEVIPAEQTIETYTNAQGQYSFNLLAPGRYLIALNPKGQPGEFDPPYPRTYYPGTSDPVQANVVTVGEGQDTSIGEFRLPPPLVGRMIEGVVTWPDGTPVVGAYLTLVYTERNWLEIRGRTDDAGNFSLKAFEGYRYLVYADYDAGGKRMHAQPVEVLVNEKSEPAKMVISEVGRSNYFRSNGKNNEH